MANLNMKNERMIRITDLIEYILKRWRLLLIYMIIFGILLNVFACFKSYQSMAQAEMQDEAEELSQYEEILSEKEISEVKSAVDSYQIYEQSYADYLEYSANSIKMQLDANAVSTQKMIYQITSNQIDAINISDVFTEIIPNDTTCQKILEETGWDVDISYIKELITVTNMYTGFMSDSSGQGITNIVENNTADNMSVLVTINIIADNKDDCAVVKKAIEEEVNSLTNDLKSEFEEFDVKKISDLYGVKADSSLRQDQQNLVTAINSVNNSMQTLENNLSEDQKSYFSALINKEVELKEEGNGGSTSVDLSQIQYINIKYIVVGAMIGAILCCLYIICGFCANRYLLSPNYIADNLDSEVLMVYTEEKKNDKKVNIIDRWISSIFKRNGDWYTESKQLNMLFARIQIAVEKSNLRKIHLVSSLKNENIRHFILDLSKRLEEEKIDFSTGESILSDIDSLEKFSGADGVVFVEQINKTLLSEMEQEVSLCNKYDVKNLGFILMSNK